MPKRPRDEDDEFEVVDEEEERPRKKPKQRPPAKETRATRVDETDEYEERPRRRRRDEDDAEEDDRPSRRREEVDEDDDRPRKRKKPRLTKADRERMRREDEDARDAARENLIFEWTGPIALTFCGVLMTVISGVILARRTDGLINPALLLAVTTAWTCVLVPVVIAALMVIGSVAGIDYGTLKNAVRSLVAITFFVNGIYWIGNLYLLGYFLAPLVAGVITFALFMMFFGLDPQETGTSLGILNLILWVANVFFKAVIIAALSGGFGKKDRDNFDDGPPRVQQPGQFDPNPGGRPNAGDDGDEN